MATHSSILAWRIPCTEEPGSLQSTGVAKRQTQLSIHVTSTSGMARDEGRCPKGPFQVPVSIVLSLLLHLPEGSTIFCLGRSVQREYSPNYQALSSKLKELPHKSPSQITIQNQAC